MSCAAPSTAPLLTRTPTSADLERLYHELAQLGAPSLGQRRAWPYRPASVEEHLALAGDMLRYDARLLTILVQLWLSRWPELHLTRLRRLMQRMRHPQALLVMAEFARLAVADKEMHHAIDYLSRSWPRLHPAERFFLDTERPGSRTALRRLGRNLKPYARWGFLGTERPTVDMATRRTVGSYDAATRRRILDGLAASNMPFTLADYLAAIDHTVSRQQATSDLRRHPRLQVSGHGRGARWQMPQGS